MTFKHWLNYFQSNQSHFDHIKWNETDKLTLKEINSITSSIQQFQKGENSEGKNLIKFAVQFSDADYLDAIKLFIKEEQRHARVLARVMELNGIERIKEHWIDSVFRRLRILSNIENSIVVLLTAEIIAAVYYKALQRSTKSKLLRSICEQILIDEEMHINFQSFFLNRLYSKKRSTGKMYFQYFRKFLMNGTTLVVWQSHKKVLKAGGYDLQRFYDEVFDEFDRTKNMITGVAKISIRTYSEEQHFQRIESVAS